MPLNDDSEAILNQILASSEDADDDVGTFTQKQASVNASAPATAPEESPKTKLLENHAQWALGGNGKYQPIGSTVEKLPAGVYETFAVPGMWGVEKLDINSDGIYHLPDMATQLVLDEVQKFWDSEDKYRKHKLLYKRGILLFGPPGGGKTVAIKMLINELISKDGIVLIISDVRLAIVVLKAIRRIEPKRNLIVLFEDIDEIIGYNGEASVLSMLDGENNVDNILHIATTNYPEKLGPRLVNRPSRFDRRLHVGMPSDAARKAYLEKATDNGLSEEQLVQWVADTKEMSVAHLRELVAAVYCLDQPYPEVVKRLQEMAKAIKVDQDFKKRGVGFAELTVSNLTTGEGK